MNYYIYGVNDNGVIVYVGRTINIEKRQNEHRREKGKHVFLDILQTVTEEEVIESEGYWIKKLKPKLNKILGASGPRTGYKQSEESKIKNSISHKKIAETTSINSKIMHSSFTEEQKEKRSSKLKAGATKQWERMSPEEYDQMRQKIKDKTKMAMNTPEVKLKMQEAQRRKRERKLGLEISS